MNRIFIILILISLSLSACTDNFDELNDTNQRYVTFTLNNSAILNNVLLPSGDTFALGTTLPPDYRLHISTYCYDMTSKLVSSESCFSDLTGEDSITIRHLDKNNDYLFLFVADVVHYTSPSNFQTTWFQVDQQNAISFYLVNFNHEDILLNNLLFTSSTTKKPDNKVTPITLEPATNNGYLRFTNTSSVDKIYGDIIQYNSFYPINNHGKKKLIYPYYIEEPSDFILMPIIASIADESIKINIKIYHDLRQDSVSVSLSNLQHSPFVADFNCTSLQLDNVNYY